MGLQVSEYILISWTPADGGLLQNVSPWRESHTWWSRKYHVFPKVRANEIYQEALPGEPWKGQDACNSFWIFFWDKTFAKTPGETYSKKNTRKTSTDQGDLPRHLRSFVPKGSKKRGHQWSPGTGSLDPANPIQPKMPSHIPWFWSSPGPKENRRVSKHIEKDRWDDASWKPHDIVANRSGPVALAEQISIPIIQTCPYSSDYRFTYQKNGFLKQVDSSKT